MAQDDYYYEIQLTNKQLVFYFMAGAAGLVLSFLAGVWVGRGVDPSSEAATRVQEEKVIAEEPLRPSPSPVQELTYAKRLEGQATDDALQPRPGKPSPPPPTEPARPVATPKPEPTPKATPKPKPTPTPKAEKPPSGKFALQVGAFKDRASAESVVGKLKEKGFPAYVQEGGEGGLFNVRVGGYATREEADRIKGRLQDEEKLKPFVVKP